MDKKISIMDTFGAFLVKVRRQSRVHSFGKPSDAHASEMGAFDKKSAPLSIGRRPT
jgi:hypothetical protein